MKCIRVWICILPRMIAQVLAGTSLIQFDEKDHHLKMQLTLMPTVWHLYSLTCIFILKATDQWEVTFPDLGCWKRRLMRELVSLLHGINIKIKLLDNCRGWKSSENWMKMLWALVLREIKNCVKIWLRYFKFCI